MQGCMELESLSVEISHLRLSETREKSLLQTNERFSKRRSQVLPTTTYYSSRYDEQCSSSSASQSPLTAFLFSQSNFFLGNRVLLDPIPARRRHYHHRHRRRHHRCRARREREPAHSPLSHSLMPRARTTAMNTVNSAPHSITFPHLLVLCMFPDLLLHVCYSYQ